MRLDTMDKEFFEKYNREMMESISDLSLDKSLSLTDSKIKLFNIEESFEKFEKYLKGYGDYKVKFNESEEASPQSSIREAVNKFIDEELFKDYDFRYDESYKLVTSYLDGQRSLNKTINEVKDFMMENNVKMDDIGDINEFTDLFVDKLNIKFHESMDKLLWASGYNTKQHLANIKKKDPIIFV